MPAPIYLDHNATTPVDARVLERMLPFFSEHYGNASSKGHAFGWAAEEAVTQAREQAAALLSAEPRALTFMSGATEAINMALRGVAATYAERKGRHFVTVQTEHKAVLDTCRALGRQGFEVTYLPVDESGLLALADLQAALREDTLLAAVMWANNETGVLQPIPEIAEVVREAGALFMTDATQAVGKIPVDVQHADLLACSAHKLYGPKGVGALYASRRRPRVRLQPMLTGGGQEEGRRGGTLNVPGIVGMGAAAEIAAERLAADAERLAPLRDAFEERLTDALSGVQINGKDAPRLPQTSSVTFRGVKAENLEASLRALAVATGSACSTGSQKPSHVLQAMGLSDADARSTLRFSLGRATTEDDMDRAAEEVIRAVRQLRNVAAWA